MYCITFFLRCILCTKASQENKNINQHLQDTICLLHHKPIPMYAKSFMANSYPHVLIKLQPAEFCILPHVDLNLPYMTFIFP